MPRSMRVIFAVPGVFFGLFGALIALGVGSQPQQKGPAAVVAGAVMVLLGLYFLVLGARSHALAVDEHGLRLRALLRIRVIPWPLVRSFRVKGRSGFWSVWVELAAGKEILLLCTMGGRDRAERIAAELTGAKRAWLRRPPLSAFGG